MLGEHWFKGYPGVSMLINKMGVVAAHRENAQQLLHDEKRLAIVFPEGGQKGSRKLYWQRYKLRRFGRGGFVRTAMRAGVPIVPIAVVGAEEAMPIFAHMPLMQPPIVRPVPHRDVKQARSQGRSTHCRGIPKVRLDRPNLRHQCLLS